MPSKPSRGSIKFIAGEIFMCIWITTFSDVEFMPQNLRLYHEKYFWLRKYFVLENSSYEFRTDIYDMSGMTFIRSTNVPTINYNGIVSKTSLVVSFISDYAAIIFGNYSFSDLSTMIPNATYFSAISVISSHKNISILSLILWLQLTDVCNFFLEEFR